MNLYSGSESDEFGYDLTVSDEEQLIAVVDGLSPQASRASAQQPARARASPGGPPATPSKSRPSPAVPSGCASSHRQPASSFLDGRLNATTAVHETLADLDPDDLDFDITELELSQPEFSQVKSSQLESSPGFSNATPSARHFSPQRPQPPAIQRWLAPTVSAASDVEDRGSLLSFVSRTKPRSTPSILTEEPVQYPNLSRALSDALKSPGTPLETDQTDDQQTIITSRSGDTRPPLLRWRTFPKKPLSVSDLTAGSWCELQHFYVLDRRGGRRFRTEAMKAGSVIHERLEREVHTPVQVDIATREDAFGLKIWNIIQGLRTLRDTGIARELEVWGFIDGQLVNGIVDGLSYENPDPSLEEETLSTRGSQSSSQSSQYQLSLGNKLIFITDVKTRSSKRPPSHAQARGTMVQLFLYHRFISDMASSKLDYLRVFARYGLRPDEPFSDSFVAQMASLHDFFHSDSDGESFDSDFTTTTTATTEKAPSIDSDDFVTAVSTPERLGNSLSDIVYMKYRTLRSLIPLLKWELQMTFPRGSSSLGQVVAVEYRYRAKSEDDEEGGSVIGVDSYFVEPEILNEYLRETMQWWKGEREPQGVQIEEAFKCRTCEFVEDCEWRVNLDQERLRKARKRGREREAKRKQKSQGV